MESGFSWRVADAGARRVALCRIATHAARRREPPIVFASEFARAYLVNNDRAASSERFGLMERQTQVT